MIVENVGGKDFDPDPLLDFETDYEARIVGITTVGTHQKGVWDQAKNGFKEGEFVEVQQCIALLEFTEEETKLSRGEDDDIKLVPRTAVHFMKYNSHEKGGLFKLAKQANPKAVSVVKGKGVVDTSKMIGEPVNVRMKADKKDENKMYIDEITAISSKYKNNVDPMTLAPFQYDVNSGSHPLADGTETSIEDVPVWMLKFALNKAIDAEDFKMIEEIEEYVESKDKEKEEGQTELEGDRRPAKSEDTPKVEPKEPELEEESEDKEKAPAKSTRSRRGSKKAAKHTKESLEALGIDALEDLFIAEVNDADKSEESLDAFDADSEDDDQYTAKIIEAILAL